MDKVEEFGVSGTITSEYRFLEEMSPKTEYNDIQCKSRA